MPPRRPRAVRAMFFDAGNTLLRMNYAAIADALRDAGYIVDPETLERAEWRARVRLDAHLGGGAATEGRSTGDRYLEYLLEEAGIADPAVIEPLRRWRRDYNQPVGVFDTAEPDAEAALLLARAHGLRVGVISNSNGSVESIFDS